MKMVPTGFGSLRTAEIRSALAGRPMVWFGTRGTDALPLWAIAKPTLVASQIAPIATRLPVREDCLETALGRRYDLDRYDIDLDGSREVIAFKRRVLGISADGGVIIAYRPVEFLAALRFCSPTAPAVYNFHLFQRQFEHKPWTDRALLRLDPTLPIIPTTYVRDADVHAVRGLLASGPLVARTTRSSGGVGVFLIRTETDLGDRAPEHGDGFLCISRFLEGATPLNVNACVYENGSVVTFGASLQLIGVPGLTTRQFGFCGNDFGAATHVPPNVLDRVQDAAERVGSCLARLGYRGLFGVDLLLAEEDLTIVEVNARLQASTALSSMIHQTLRTPDPTTEHVAAFLGMAAPTAPDLKEVAAATRSLMGVSAVAQVFHRNLAPRAIYPRRPRQDGRGCQVDAVAAPDIQIDPGAVMYRSLHWNAVTESGYDLKVGDAELDEPSRE